MIVIVLIRFTWLTVKKRQNSFKVSNTMKQLRKAEIVCKIIKLDFSMGYGSVPCNVCDVTVCSSCACCVVGQNPSQTSAWCPMVTAQLANMTGYTYFLLLFFLNFIILSLEPIKRCNCTKFKLLMIFMLQSGCCSFLLGNRTTTKTKPQCLSMHWLHKNIWLLWMFLHFLHQHV